MSGIAIAGDGTGELCGFLGLLDVPALLDAVVDQGNESGSNDDASLY